VYKLRAVWECLLSFRAESLSSTLLSKNIKIKIYRIVILPFVLYGFETWSLIEGGTKAEGNGE
jgi:hypothetical protein